MKDYNAFTSSYAGLSNKLINTLEIVNGSVKITVRAQWDTGATNTCISHDVVQKLSLVSTGFVRNHTPSGTAIQNVYKIDINLPNHIKVNDIPVSESEIGNQGIDVLIGMDIISMGDFSVSNYSGKTVFSFRTPSIACTDYVKLHNASKPVRNTDIKTYSNDPCPCGSGKKYKHCCGKNK